MALLLLNLVGCSLFASTAGEWEGDCNASGYTFPIDMELQEAGGDIEGEATLTLYGTKLEGDVEGERDGMDVELSMTFKASGYTIAFEFEGELDGNELEGEIAGSGGSIDCDFER